MKILITLYPLNNYGGIINNQEGLYAGLRELGHQVDVRLLIWKDDIRVQAARRSNEMEISEMGVQYEQELGWVFPANMRFAYKGKENLKLWKEFVSGYDLIIWQIPVPTHQRENRGNLDWLELYNVPTKQIAYIHDGNMEDSYPWIAAVQDKFCGAAGTHPCAYQSLISLPLPRALVFTAQKDIEARQKAADSAKAKRDGWFSLQTFKGWKHVEDVVRAIPYMSKYPKVMAGGGLHRYYMTSKDKLKDTYVCSKTYDPDVDKKWIGKSIWSRAEAYGMEYLDYVTNATREARLAQARFLIDPSWSKKYAEYGDHINRVSIDSLIAGAVPIARNLGIATNEKGIGEFFRPNETYCMIPWDYNPRMFGEMVDEFHNRPASKLRAIVEKGRAEIVPLFDYRRVAQAFIDLANGKPAGVYKKKGDRGFFNPEMKKASDEALEEFFGGEAISHDSD